MKRILVLVVGLASSGLIWSAELPQMVCLGDAAHPVIAGEAWLIANRWAAYQGVLVGTIENGQFERRKMVELPPYWDQAFDYKLLLAISDHVIGTPTAKETADAYGWFGRCPDYLKRFSTVFLSAPLPREESGQDWESAFSELGHLSGQSLILPRPQPRIFRLVYPDGRPLTSTRLSVSLFGSSENHCGAAVGIWLGNYVTDAKGSIAVNAPPEAVALGIRHFKKVAGGPAGTAFALLDDLVVQPGQSADIQELWSLPRYDYVVAVGMADGRPITQARLEGCLFRPPCMSGCGPITSAESNVSGVFRFRAADLREMGSITVVDNKGNKMDLTDSQMRQLVTTHRVNLVWK